VKEVWAARQPSLEGQGSLDISAPDGTEIALDSRIPDEALDALAEIDWDAVRGDYLTWDDDRREWYAR